MAETAVLIIALLGLAAALAAAGIATLVLSRVKALAAADPLSPQTLAQLLRAETDSLKQHGGEEARGLRQELNDLIRGSFRDLGDNVRVRIEGFGAKLDADIAHMGEDATKNRDGLRQLVETKLDASATNHAEQAKALRDELGAGFQRLGGHINATLVELGERQKERLDHSTRALETLTEKSEKSQDALKQTVEGRLDAIRLESAEKLEHIRLTVDEKLQTTLETRLGESFNRVVEQLNRVHEGLGEMKSLASNVGDLRNVLTNVKVRGTFGEVQLELLLEQFLTPDQYIKDARVREHTSERVEFAIRFPGKGGGEEVLLPVDAKFPRESYERLILASENGDGAGIELHRKQLLAQVRTCAKEIRDKYIHPPRTTDFALLFLPTEGLYAEVLRQPGMFESVQRDYKVTFAGPTTLSAILNAFQMGFRSIAIEKRSSEVWQVLGAVKSEFEKYNAVVERLGKQLSTAATSVEQLGKRTRVMSRRLKTVETLPESVSGAALLGFDGDEVEAGEEPRFPSSIASDILLPVDEA